MPPKASIVMPVHNVAAYVAESIASVQAQTFESWELIVVEDGSTDGTEGIVQVLANADPRIRLFSQRNAGVASARNRGLDMAQGEFLVFLDGDDLWRRDYLERAVGKLEETQADFFFCGVAYLETNGSLRPCVMKPLQGISGSAPLVEGVLSGEITFCMGSVAIRMTPEIRGLRFTEGCRHGEDTEYLLRVLPVARSACFLEEPLFLYRVRPGSATQQPWDWRIRIDGIHAMDRALDHLHAHSRNCRMPVIEDDRSRRHFSKYRFMYRMVKAGAWQEVRDLLEQERWRAALHSVVEREPRFHRYKARVILGRNQLIWHLVALYARCKAWPVFADQKGT